MKRKVILWIFGILVVVLGIGKGIHSLDTQRTLVPLESGPIVASLPIVSHMPLQVELGDNLIFKLDTGTDISCITASDLDILKARGCKVTERNLPVIGRTSDGKLHTYLKRYVIDLPLRFVTTHPDSTGTRMIRQHIAEEDNVLKDAEFVLMEGDSASSALGIDILQRFAMEYVYDNQLIRLHQSVPDGYQDFSSFRASVWPSHILWPGKRFYLDIDIDNITDAYFIDTGLRIAPIKLPGSRAPQVRRRNGGDSSASAHATAAVRTENVWVEIGNRAGSQKAFYVDNGEEPYSINPINVFTQDLLIDFPRSCIALRPYASQQHRHGSVSSSASSSASPDIKPRKGFRMKK